MINNLEEPMSISSPCVSICEKENGRCIGCGRTEQEIEVWRDLSETERLEIMARLEHEAANGGWFAADAFGTPAATPASSAGSG